ncbi:MAG: hypothetical protein K9L85_00120 [Candidatus Peribacteraceae bacterium]|nr:hypothetical protein [Candidatus Peribacteraceae bacterium]
MPEISENNATILSKKELREIISSIGNSVNINFENALAKIAIANRILFARLKPQKIQNIWD